MIFRQNRRTRMILIGIAAAITGAAVLVTLVSGENISRAHLQPWSRNYHKRFRDPRMQIIAHALLAPNGHNMQPWLVRLSDDPAVFYLYADPDRLNPEIDPFARQAMITQGAFLEYARVAGQQLGYEVDVELFPDGEFDEQGSKESLRSHPAARVKLTSSRPRATELYEAMFLPDTSRVPYEKEDVPADLLRRLESVGKLGNARLVVYGDQANCLRLRDLAWRAAETECAIPEVAAANSALFRSNAWQKSKHRYGFALDGQGVSGLKLALMETFLTLVPSANSPEASRNAFLNQVKAALSNTPAYALIVTDGNSRKSQVEAGMLYVRFQLTCQSVGLAVQPLSQSQEEYEEMRPIRRSLHQTFASESETVQMLVRFGKPTRKVPHSMRRDADALIVSE